MRVPKKVATVFLISMVAVSFFGACVAEVDDAATEERSTTDESSPLVTPEEDDAQSTLERNHGYYCRHRCEQSYHHCLQNVGHGANPLVLALTYRCRGAYLQCLRRCGHGHHGGHIP